MRARDPEQVGRRPKLGPVATYLRHPREEVECTQKIVVDALGNRPPVTFLEISFSRSTYLVSGSHFAAKALIDPVDARRRSPRGRLGARLVPQPPRRPRSARAAPRGEKRTALRVPARHTTSSTDRKCPAWIWARTSSLSSSGSEARSMRASIPAPVDRPSGCRLVSAGKQAASTRERSAMPEVGANGVPSGTLIPAR